MNAAPSQRDLFDVPTFHTLDALLGRNGGPPTIVVGCGQRKESAATPARELYVSERFQTCRNVAEILSAPYHILSGRHGLVTPGTILESYDLDLAILPEKARRIWADDALANLSKRTSGPITLLASGSYAQTLITRNILRSTLLPIFAPLLEVELGHHQTWLSQAFADARRIRDLRLLYELMVYAKHSGATFKLENLADQNLPMRGVYVFLGTRLRRILWDARLE
jgi:hypothetical protein